MRSTLDWEILLERANAARKVAYAPYSQYAVGAALLTAGGRMFAGCNVENASYPAGICAERTAIATMVAAGERAPIALVIVTRGPEPAAPCGICRQVLAEFALDLPILLIAEAEGVEANAEDKPARVLTSLSELLPRAFRGAALQP